MSSAFEASEFFFHHEYCHYCIHFCSTLRMYSPYTLQALAASSCDNLDFTVNLHDPSA